MLRGVIHQGSHRGQLFVGGRRHCIGQVCAKEKKNNMRIYCWHCFFQHCFYFFPARMFFFFVRTCFSRTIKGRIHFFFGRFFCTMATILRSYRWSRCQCSVPGHCRLLLPRPHTRTLGPVPLWTSAVACCVAPGSVAVVPPTRRHMHGRGGWWWCTIQPLLCGCASRVLSLIARRQWPGGDVGVLVLL